MYNEDENSVRNALFIDYYLCCRFYAVTSRRYSTLSRCNNSISQTVKHHQHQQHQQQFVRNDNMTSQFTAHIPQHPANGDVTVTAAERQYFVLDPEQQ